MTVTQHGAEGPHRGTITPAEPSAPANTLCDQVDAMPARSGPRGVKQVGKREQDTRISCVCWLQLREGEITSRRVSVNYTQDHSHCMLLLAAAR